MRAGKAKEATRLESQSEIAGRRIGRLLASKKDLLQQRSREQARRGSLSLRL